MLKSLSMLLKKKMLQKDGQNMKPAISSNLKQNKCESCPCLHNLRGVSRAEVEPLHDHVSTFYMQTTDHDQIRDFCSDFHATLADLLKVRVRLNIKQLNKKRCYALSIL